MNDEMKLYNQEFKQNIYDLVTDRLRVDTTIKNEFESGSFCDQKYQEIYEANKHLCDKLDVKEDPDVECIINNFFDISKYISIKMFDYGIFFATEQLKKE